MAWEKVVELMVVNRLIAPGSELFIHEKWFGQTAMAALLDTEERVAETDWLCRQPAYAALVAGCVPKSGRATKRKSSRSWPPVGETGWTRSTCLAI